ncbi:uncharacterized protein LOC115620566 [Scaptodrosophila lebanonensis]|uniref:Uncharacterized protein LOC115620566 n=1 Tax=Drosophila lebanonensis TaxID=7225 RepID=A0A6J2SYR1_DROLE|nr:uncharacterized protein LOC115620566 [Scaptodrosophila lebanonensis]XP_030369716.1 uncharacterized protein LOC115620566 [Scaptodrosophila lebanonensis]
MVTNTPRPEAAPAQQLHYPCPRLRSCVRKCCSWRCAAWLLAAICLITRSVLAEVIYRVDPLALLAGTLRTYQRAGCDSEQLSLSCPRGTSISIELAQYGRAGDLTDHSLCPPISQENSATSGSGGEALIHIASENELKSPETCTVSGLQYALLQAVVDTCQKKRHCKFAANSRSRSSGDPCSRIRKFVEIAYKCRPYEFRSKVACENDSMPLVCNPYSRIAIYSASFGHTERESVQCNSQVSGTDSMSSIAGGSSKSTCLVSYATETAMQICHGRRRCSVTADSSTFGRPCKADVRMYLKVVYTCIPRKVLKDRYETAPESDELQQGELEFDHDELYDEDQFYKESEAVPPAPKLQGAIPNAGLPYELEPIAIGEGQTSTNFPPLLSPNDVTLEDKLGLSMRFLNRIMAAMNQEQPTTAAVTHEQDVGAAEVITKATEDSKESDIATDVAKNKESIQSTAKNFFYRRKCQMVDNLDLVSLNCTEGDYILEHVEVVGFLINWLDTYLHIRKHQQKFYLYLLISATIGVLLCVTVVIGRMTLQKHRGVRKKGDAIEGSRAKTIGDAAGRGGDTRINIHQLKGGTKHAADSFGDISDIDADVDILSPISLPSVSSRNDGTCMNHALSPNCTSGVLSASTATTTVLMAKAQVSQHNGLLLSETETGPGTGRTKLMSSGRGCQPTPPPATIYTSITQPLVSGAMQMGPHMLGPSSLNTMSPSYLSGTVIMAGQHQAHASSLRRTLLPNNMGFVRTPSPPPVSALPSSSSVYYDTTVPHTLSRGMSADRTAQHFYG